MSSQQRLYKNLLDYNRRYLKEFCAKPVNTINEYRIESLTNSIKWLLKRIQK